MRKNITHIYIVMLAVLILTPAVFAQSNEGPIKVLQQSANKDNDKLNANFDVVLDDLKLNRNDMIIMTPVLKSNTSEDSLVLEPIVVLGKTRDKVVRRNIKYNNPSPMPENSYISLKRKNGMLMSEGIKIKSPQKTKSYSRALIRSDNKRPKFLKH